MRLLPPYSSAVLNICPRLPFQWKISEHSVNSRLEMNNNNIKIKNARLMPSYNIIFYTLFKKKQKKHEFCLTLPSFATASTSTSLAPRMNLVMTTGCSWRTDSSQFFWILSTDQGCNISSWNLTVQFSDEDRFHCTNELMEFWNFKVIENRMTKNQGNMDIDPGNGAVLGRRQMQGTVMAPQHS